MTHSSLLTDRGSDSATPAIEPLERAPLEALYQHGGARLVQRMIEVVIATLAQRLEAAWEAHRNDDAPTLGWAVHSMKSSAGIVGSRRVRDVAAALEREAAAAPGRRVELLEELAEAHAALMRALTEERVRYSG